MTIRTALFLAFLAATSGAPASATASTADVAPATRPASVTVPAGIQLPFEPNVELLARMQQTRCWSEYRLYDPVAKVLGATIALEWYDKLDEAISRLYLRQDGQQRAFKRTSVRYQSPVSKTTREATGDNGPDSVGTKWTATYEISPKIKGIATMQVIEGGPSDDEHVSVGTLTMRGVLAGPTAVAHSAGCDRSPLGS